MTNRSSTPGSTISRRKFLAATGSAGIGAAAIAGTTPVAATQGDAVDGWLADVDNYEGVVDERGSPEVTITVGAAGNGGSFAFEPAAVQVDPGTTIVGEWSGKGGVHNVSATDGSFETDLTDEAGHTFERTVEAEGLLTYACVPHEAMGMKGAVVVGDQAAAASGAANGGDDGELLAVGGGLGLAAAIFGVFAYGVREHRGRSHSGARP